MLKAFYAEQSGGAPEHMLSMGDPYAAQKPSEASDYFAYLQSKKQSGGGGQGGQTGGYSRGGRGGKKIGQRGQHVTQNHSTGGQNISAGGQSRGSKSETLLNGICRDFNRNSCTKTAQTCRFKHVCNKTVR